jgi:hypothetical protein
MTGDARLVDQREPEVPIIAAVAEHAVVDERTAACRA